MAGYADEPLFPFSTEIMGNENIEYIIKYCRDQFSYLDIIERLILKKIDLKELYYETDVDFKVAYTTS